MTNSTIIQPIGAVVIAIVLFVLVLAALIVKKFTKNSQQSVKSVRSETSKSETVKSSNFGKIVCIVILCLIVITLTVNFAVFLFILSPYESTGEIYEGFDELVKETKQKLDNVDVSNLPDSSLNMFKITRGRILTLASQMKTIEKMNEFLEYTNEDEKYVTILNDEMPHLADFDSIVNKLKAHVETKPCTLNVDWGSDVFKIYDRVVTTIIGLMRTQENALPDMLTAHEQKLKTQTAEQLGNEENKVKKHLESTKNLIGFLQKHFDTMKTIGAEKRGVEISPKERYIAISLILGFTAVTVVLCVFTIYAIIQSIRNKISNWIQTAFTSTVYITACQVVIIFLLIVIFSIAGYVGVSCVSPIKSDVFTMSSFDERSTLYSNEIFKSCSSPSMLLFSANGPRILLSSDIIIQYLKNNQQDFGNSSSSEVFDSLIVEWNKVRALHVIMSNLAKENTCFDGDNLQEIEKRRDIIQKLVDGADTYGNATIRIKSLNLQRNLSDLFFEEVKTHIETAITPVNNKMKLSDFECYHISALHSKCAKLQCPKEHSYYDETLIHLIIVLVLSTVLLFILLHINKLSKNDAIDLETPSNPSQNSQVNSKISAQKTDKSDYKLAIENVKKQTQKTPDTEKAIKKIKKNRDDKKKKDKKGIWIMKALSRKAKSASKTARRKETSNRAQNVEPANNEETENVSEEPEYIHPLTNRPLEPEFLPTSYDDHTMRCVL